MSMVKIGIIEDSEIHREWLKAELAADKTIDVVSLDYLGRKGIESVRALQADLVILDFQLEDMTGLEVARRIKVHNENVKIFMLTAHNETSIVERIMNDKNIDALAIKGSPYLDDNLLAAIKNIINGGTYLEPSLFKKLRESKKLAGLSQLTKREFEIFIQSNTGKSDEQIADDLCVELSHVKNTKSKIAKKIKNDDIDGILLKLLRNNNPDTLKVIYE